MPETFLAWPELKHSYPRRSVASLRQLVFSYAHSVFAAEISKSSAQHMRSPDTCRPLSSSMSFEVKTFYRELPPGRKQFKNTRLASGCNEFCWDVRESNSIVASRARSDCAKCHHNVLNRRAVFLCLVQPLPFRAYVEIPRICCIQKRCRKVDFKVPYALSP